MPWVKEKNQPSFQVSKFPSLCRSYIQQQLSLGAKKKISQVSKSYIQQKLSVGATRSSVVLCRLCHDCAEQLV